MTPMHDPIRQLRHFRNCLSQNNRPTGFLLSAGCPLAIRDTATSDPLIPDIKGLTDHVQNEMSKKKSKDNYTKLLDEITKAGKKKDNIEDILSFVRSLKDVAKGGDVRGFSESDLDDLEKEICKIISAKMNVELPNKDTPYHKLVAWIASIDREIPIELFTTNYDLLMEQALEDSSRPYFDGFVGSKKPFFDPELEEIVNRASIPNHWTRLWKIHGSINWYSNEKSITRLTSVSEEGNNLIYPSHLKYSESRKMPYLALMDRLKDFIRQNGSILILSGYSFRDWHINDTIIGALQANPTAIVIGLLFGKLSDYQDAIKLAGEDKRPNLSLWAFDEAIVGTTRGGWSKPSDDKLKEENYANAIKLITGSTSNAQVELGNFEMLGNYLQSIIGQDKEMEKNGK
jgi:hypothetical protein